LLPQDLRVQALSKILAGLSAGKKEFATLN
jgi:hypothetical protein